jgi:DNA uptake protein ComE-like DNA-binding protein
MTDSLFNVLLPFISLESPAPPLRKGKTFATASSGRNFTPAHWENSLAIPDGMNRELVVIELNRADSAQLVQLPGIGPVIAARIIRYRNLLGGFCSVDQLLEVYGMTPERRGELAGRVMVDTSMVQPLRINFAGFQQLSRHPYIRKDLAGKIMDWRSAKGPVSELSELLRAGLLDSVQWRKLGSYLTCR